MILLEHILGYLLVFTHGRMGTKCSHKQTGWRTSEADTGHNDICTFVASMNDIIDITGYCRSDRVKY